MKVRKRCPECNTLIEVAINSFVELNCPQCQVLLQVADGVFLKESISQEEWEVKQNAPAFSSPAWLLLGMVNSLPGILKLQDFRLEYIALDSGSLWMKGLRRLEKRMEVPGLAERLDNGENTPLFAVELSEVQSIYFPFYYFGAGVHLKINNQKLRLSFIQPQNTQMPARGFQGVHKIPGAMSVGKYWKSLLIK